MTFEARPRGSAGRPLLIQGGSAPWTRKNKNDQPFSNTNKWDWARFIGDVFDEKYSKKRCFGYFSIKKSRTVPPAHVERPFLGLFLTPN